MTTLKRNKLIVVVLVALTIAFLLIGVGFLYPFVPYFDGIKDGSSWLLVILLVGLIVYLLLGIDVRYLKWLIIVEALVTAFLFTLRTGCGSFCDPHSLLNPFGLPEEYIPFIAPDGCVPTAAPFAWCITRMHPSFYVFADLLILTSIIFCIRIILRITKIQTPNEA